MKLIVGIDIGNATTESTLAEVDGEKIKVIGSSIEKTTGIKGTKENFEAEVLKAEGIVVVDFGANWCGPCKSLVPILDEVVEEDPSKKIVKVDIDEEEELAAQYKIMSVPTLLVFRNGEIIDKSVGLIQKHEVKALFSK